MSKRKKTEKVLKPLKIAERVVKGTETILLVDDEEPVLKLGGKVLNRLGYTVFDASNGHEAVDIYQTNRDAIDLVILDMIMPDISGDKVYDMLKSIDPNIKVLLCSGYGFDKRVTEILAQGCSGFIQKPFDMVTLSYKIRKILEE